MCHINTCLQLSHFIIVSCSLTQVIRKFAKQLDEWLKMALHDLPENLRNIKFERKSGLCRISFEFGLL